MTRAFLVNHLWQCTWFAAAAAVVSFALRRNSPKVRYWIWLAASVKFLIPFWLFVAAGSLVPWPSSPVRVVPAPVFPDAIAFVAEPFPQAMPVAASAHGSIDIVPIALAAMWVAGFVSISLWRRRQWLAVRAAVRTGTTVALPIEIPAVTVPGIVGPGVVGLLRPVLVLPAQLLERLTAAQLDAVLAHESSHVRRRDNVFAAVHMAVEAIFWFHPLVWWIGSRMLDERERSCDEDVVANGCEPADYAASILTVCRFHTEFALSCVAGVAGANVKQRIHAILEGCAARELNLVRKMSLTALGVAIIAVPIAVGVFDASVRAQSLLLTSDGGPRPSFDVVSIKRVDRALMTRDHEGRQLTPTRFIDRTELLQYIVRAYVPGGGCALKTGIGQDCPLLVGTLPEWVRRDRFEVQATFKPGSETYSDYQGRRAITPRLNLMLQVLLEDRFHLRVHRETRELPVYALVVGKNALARARRLTPTPPGGEFRTVVDGKRMEIHGMAMALRTSLGTTRMTFQASSMQDAAESFAPYFDRLVVDRTGLKGQFDFTLEPEFDRDAPVPAATPNTSGRGGNYANPFTGLTAAGLSTALQEVGLRLESTRAPIEVLVIDSVEKPTEN